MVQIAQKYTDQATQKQYLEAVQKFRLPYWDYFWPRDYEATFTGVLIHETKTKFPYSFQLPQIFHLSSLKIRKAPDNSWDIVDNPFKEYNFPESTQDPHFDIRGVDFLANYNSVRHALVQTLLY
jgi:tyrosinase